MKEYKKYIIVSLIIIFFIMFYLLIRNKKETFETNTNTIICKTPDVISKYNAIMSSASSINSKFVDDSTISNYSNALSSFISSYNAIPDCSSFNTTNNTYDGNGNFVCYGVLSKDSSGKLVCSPNDMSTVYNCITGTIFTYSSCVNGTSSMTRAGDIKALNGGVVCPPTIKNVSCANCTSTYTITPFSGNSNKITTVISNIIPAFNGGVCNITASSTVSCINNNFVDTNNCQYCVAGWYGSDCNTPDTANITQSGTYSIPSGVTALVVTVIGGGGGGSLLVSNNTVQTNGIYSLNGGAGRVILPGTDGFNIVETPIPLNGNTTFTVNIGNGGTFFRQNDYSGYDINVLTNTPANNNGGDTKFSIGSLNITSSGGIGGWKGVSVVRISPSTSTPPKNYVQSYGSQYQTGRGYGDGGNSADICGDMEGMELCKLQGEGGGGNGKNGAVIVKYIFGSQSIPASMPPGVSRIVDVTLTSSVLNVPVPAYAKSVSILAVGGGGGGWYGGVTSVANLPAAFASYDYILTFISQTYAQNNSTPFIYGAGPGSGGASGQYQINTVNVSSGSTISISIGNGGSGGVYTGVGTLPGTSTGIPPGDGSETSVTIGSTKVLAGGGKAATNPITPGAASGNSVSGIKFGSYTTNSLTTYQYSNSGLAPIYQNWRPDQGTPGGAISITDPVFGNVKMPTMSYFSSNGVQKITNKNTSLGCGGIGGNALVPKANYPDGYNIGQNGGAGGNGFVRLIFST